MITSEVRANIRHEYHACRVGYDQALRELVNTGMTDVEADRFLFCREQPATPVADTTYSRWPGLVRVEGYLVDTNTDQVFIVKTSKRGRDYLSTITSARRIKKALKLAKAVS